VPGKSAVKYAGRVYDAHEMANLAASADRALELGAGLQDIELGLRLRYAIRQTFAPYVGVHWERKFGDTADFARAHGEDVEDTRLVVGLRAWF
jgi:copper resistance protein B